MENRLAACFSTLKEVEEKLREVLAWSSNNEVESARISEALSFVGKALDSVAHAREDIASLSESAK